MPEIIPNGYHEHKGFSDVVRGVFIYIVSCIFLGTLADYIDYYNNSRIQAKTKWMPPSTFREASMMDFLIIRF